MTIPELKSEFLKRLPFFERAMKNVIQAFELFLQEHNLSYLTVEGRLKSFDSFVEKIERKKYSKPFEENQDFIGIRIILYYLYDIKVIQEIIESEFELQESFDKESELEVNEFGYRSKHSNCEN